MMPSSADHRAERRYDTDVEVRFVALPATIGSGRMTNISLTGAFMETASQLRLASRVYVEGLDRGVGGAVKRLAATVVRRCSAGVGLEWCSPYSMPPPKSRPAAAPPVEAPESDEASDAGCCVYRLEFID